MDIRASYMDGAVPRGLEIIDAHGHLGSSGTSSIFLRSADVGENISLSKRIGINVICASSFMSLRGDVGEGNKELFATARKHHGDIMGYVTYNPHHQGQSMADIERYLESPYFAGVKIHPRNHGCSLKSIRYEPLWEYASEMGFLVLCHTWAREPEDDPEYFFPILQKYSRIKLLIGHSGGTYDGYETCYRLVREFPGAYMDLNGSLYSMKWIEQVVEETDINRLIFSTDQAFNDPRAALGRIVLSGLADEMKRKILAGNFRSLLSETKRPGKVLDDAF